MSTREPLIVRGAIVAAIVAVLHLLVMLNVVSLTPEQEEQASLVVGLLATVVVVVWSRGTVTPVDDPRGADGEPLQPATPDDDTVLTIESDDARG